jgi:membrane-bound lytic murein transglycosylase D
MWRKHENRKMFFGHALLLMIPFATLYYNTVIPNRNYNGKWGRGALFPARHTQSRYPRFFGRSTGDGNNDNAEQARPATRKGLYKKRRGFLQKMKDRSSSYFRTIESVFDQYDIPPQLKYLAIVESALKSNATSRGGGPRSLAIYADDSKGTWS